MNTKSKKIPDVFQAELDNGVFKNYSIICSADSSTDHNASKVGKKF